ncbi:MAG: hypothetical protein NT154_15250 [Verrucomicrobia bacterium]|nr:hypothetical protein [Verrucomicrobiota bacterium]
MLNEAAKVKIALLERGIKPADVAAGTGLDLGYVYNLLSAMSEKANARFSLDAAPEASDSHGVLDPAAANTSIEWVELCGKVGFTVVALKAPYSPELWQNSGFEKRLGAELAAANLGHLDSVKWFDPITFFFYVNTKDLAAGLQLMKARLAVIGLLPRVKIGCADQAAKVWRRFWPESGEAITPNPVAGS